MPASKKKEAVLADGAELPPSLVAELERRVNQVKHSHCHCRHQLYCQRLSFISLLN
jgi:hypothetical protein